MARCLAARRDMPAPRLIIQLHELLACLGQLGVVTLLINAQQGLIGRMSTTLDVSCLAGTPSTVFVAVTGVLSDGSDALSMDAYGGGRPDLA